MNRHGRPDPIADLVADASERSVRASLAELVVALAEQLRLVRRRTTAQHEALLAARSVLMAAHRAHPGTSDPWNRCRVLDAVAAIDRAVAEHEVDDASHPSTGHAETTAGLPGRRAVRTWIARRIRRLADA